MAGRMEARLQEHGITLPEAPAPAANYVPWTIGGNIVFISGQLAFVDGQIRHKGKVGQDFDVATARDVARLCGINIIAQVRAACGGDLDRVKRCLKVGGFVACTPDFDQQPEVINGCSDLMVEVFGEAGRHARFAVGTNVLPRNVPVEIEAVFEIA